MVSAIAVWVGILAGYDLLSRGALFPSAYNRGGVHWDAFGESMAPEQLMAVKVSVDGVFEEAAICLPEA